MLNSLNFCLSVKASDFSIKSEWEVCWVEYSWFRFFSFITLKILCHSLLACRASVEKLVDILMGVPFYVICYFSLVSFNSLSLSLIFVSLITMCHNVFLFGFILPRTLCASWTWLTISFSMLGKFSAIISSNVFSGSFSLSYPPGTP